MIRVATHGNGMVTTFNADPNKVARPSSVTATYSTTTPWTSGTYAYDGSGNTRAIGSDWYIYDRLGRLVEGTSESGAKKQNLTIDSFGNITRSIITVGGVVQTDSTMSVSTATNRLIAGGNNTGTYDAAGNEITRNSTYTYGYDSLGMMQSVTGGGKDLAYIYTADDERIWELNVNLSRSEYSLRDLDHKTLRVISEDSFANPRWSWKQDYVYRGSTLHSGSLSSGGIIQYHVDHLGTPRYITNASRAQYGRHAYYPFGQESTSPTQNTEERKFTSHERDTDFSSSLDYMDYMHARYYSPVMGRFLSVDPGKDWDPKRPQSWNSYAYVRNNPVLSVDPDGRAADTVIDVISMGYGIVSMWKKALNGESVTWRDNVAVAADAGAIFVPGLTGAGHAVRISNKVDNVAGVVPTTRQSSAQIRKKWEAANGKPWPKDPATGRNQDVAHKKALADGGTNELDNIEAKVHAEHMQEHKDAGDFNRWGHRRHRADVEPPKQ